MTESPTSPKLERSHQDWVDLTEAAGLRALRADLKANKDPDHIIRTLEIKAIEEGLARIDKMGDGFCFLTEAERTLIMDAQRDVTCLDVFHPSVCGNKAIASLIDGTMAKAVDNVVLEMQRRMCSSRTPKGR